MSVLGQRIRQLRHKANLTQAQLGKLLGCSGSTVSLYEGGQRSPDTEMLVRLADVFDVSVDYLLGRVSDPAHRESRNRCRQNPRAAGLLLKASP